MDTCCTAEFSARPGVNIFRSGSINAARTLLWHRMCATGTVVPTLARLVGWPGYRALLMGPRGRRCLTTHCLFCSINRARFNKRRQMDELAFVSSPASAIVPSPMALRQCARRKDMTDTLRSGSAADWCLWMGLLCDG